MPSCRVGRAECDGPGCCPSCVGMAILAGQGGSIRTRWSNRIRPASADVLTWPGANGPIRRLSRISCTTGCTRAGTSREIPHCHCWKASSMGVQSACVRTYSIARASPAAEARSRSSWVDWSYGCNTSSRMVTVPPYSPALSAGRLR